MWLGASLAQEAAAESPDLIILTVMDDTNVWFSREASRELSPEEAAECADSGPDDQDDDINEAPTSSTGASKLFFVAFG